MAATDAEANAFLKEGAVLATKVASGVAGAVVGGVIAGPPGVIIGAALTPFLEHSITRVVADFAERQLSDKQRRRGGASVLLLADAVSERRAAGEALREDGFFTEDATGRRPIDELLEQSIQSAIASIEERRLPYLANLYASICFDQTVSRSSVATLAKLAEDMTYRRLCVLRVAADGRFWTGRSRVEGLQPEWEEEVHIIARDLDALVSDGVLVLKRRGDPGYDSNLGYLDIDPGLIQLGRIGQTLYERMGLAEIDIADETLVEVKTAIRTIADSPSPGIIIDGGLLGEPDEAEPAAR